MKIKDLKEKMRKLKRDKFVEGKTPLGIIVDALETGGSHHKQWYLEQLLFALGFDANEVRKKEQLRGFDWEDGIAP